MLVQTDKTRGMFNSETIGKMKRGAVLVRARLHSSHDMLTSMMHTAFLCMNAFQQRCSRSTVYLSGNTVHVEMS